MGNANRTSNVVSSDCVHGSYKKIEQQSESLTVNCSQRSQQSLTSQNSGFNLFRTGSRTSTSSRQTLNKEIWPISQITACFLPVFPNHPAIENNNLLFIEQLGKGSFGSVFKVKELTTNQVYALKVLSKSKIIQENIVQQVKEEVQIQKACGHHSFIVNCPYNWQSKKHLYIVTEFIPGGDFYNFLNSYSILSLELVQLFIAQIAITLDFLHNAGIIYRDLKPENILIDLQGNLVLTDFGLSKWLSYGNKTSTLCGTLKFIAPEIRASKPYGHAVDWWSLGIMTCIMLTEQ